MTSNVVLSFSSSALVLFSMSVEAGSCSIVSSLYSSIADARFLSRHRSGFRNNTSAVCMSFPGMCTIVKSYSSTCKNAEVVVSFRQCSSSRTKAPVACGQSHSQSAV
uniref:Secreted protein n=1 Tax=Ixodes ricinus TaxID=34613 RepID=A0A6B0UGR9_IXORI